MVDSSIDIRQGSCEGHVLLLFVINAAAVYMPVMDTLMILPDKLENVVFSTAALKNGYLKEPNVSSCCFPLYSNFRTAQKPKDDCTRHVLSTDTVFCFTAVNTGM